MSTVQRIAKNSFWQLFSNIAQKFFSLVVVIVLAKKLGVDNFGLYSFAFSFVSVFAIFADFGINILLIREVSKNTSGAKEFVSNALVLKLVLSVLSFLAIIVFGFWYGVNHLLFFLIILAASSMLLDNIAALFKGTFFAFEVFKYEFLVTFLYRSFFLILSLVVIFGGYGLIELMVVSVVASAFNLVLSVYFSLKYTIKPSLTVTKTKIFFILKTSIPFFLISLLMGLIANIDIILLQYFWTQTEVGSYSAAMRLVSTISMVAVILMNSLQPVTVKFYAAKNESIITIINKAVYYLSLLAFPLTVGTFVLAPQIVLLFYGEDFSRTVIPLTVLIFSLVFSFSSLVFTNILALTHKEKDVLKQLFLELAVLLALDIFLISMLAEIGAAFAFLLAKIFSFLAGYYFVSKYFSSINTFSLYFKPCLAAILMGFFTFFAMPFGLFFAVLVSVLIYAAALLLLRAFKAEDVAFFKKLFNINNWPKRWLWKKIRK